MKLTILGSGSCANQLPGESKNRFPPGFLVEFGQIKILFECSEGIRFRLEDAGYDYADIHHLAISHAHADHYALIHYLQSVSCKGIWTRTKNENLNIYCPKSITDQYPTLMKLHFPDLTGGFLFPKLKFFSMPAAEPVKIGDASLTAEKVYHAFGRIEALAFRLETPEGVFVYSGDSGDCPGIRKICAGADIFVCEDSALLNDKKAASGYGHLSARDAGNIAKNGKVKKLVLFHHTGLDSDEKIKSAVTESGFAGEAIIAKDFLTIGAL